MTRSLLAPLLFLLAGTAHAHAGDHVASPCVAGEPVAVAQFVAVGGIEQWVTMRGDDCANPVVLVVHGGPGNPLSPYADALFADWTGEFTVVTWDQRGAGRTFAQEPQADATPLTLERMTDDGVEVAMHAARALGQEKVILLGGSWGSALAVYMLDARPDLFHAYVGIGQLVHERDNMTSSVARLRALALAADDAETLAMLQELGPPPWTNPRAFGQLRRATRRYESKSTTPAPAAWWQPAAAYLTPEDQAAAEAGEEFSYIQFVGMHGDGMASHIDLPALGGDFPMPVYLIQGEHDLVTTTEIARGWFDGLNAPHKEFVLLPATGHDPNVAMIAAELAALRRIKASLPAAAAVPP